MASGIVKRQGNRFDAVYEHPWGGIASNSDAADIPPHYFFSSNSLFIKNGRLCSASWNKSNAINYSNILNQNYFVNIFVVALKTIFIYPGTWVLCAFMSDNTVYTYNTAIDAFILDQTAVPGPGAGNHPTAIQVIAGVAYVAYFTPGVLYAYTPGVSYVQATAFVGGQYMTELVGYLIQANTNQPTDSPAVKFNRYNWSSPFGYSTWDPSLDRTAGFNTISEVADEITGLFAMGNVGYVLRGQGVSQLSPTGVGTAPFDVTPLWESEFGIGCTYPDTFSQYGNLAVWANDNNIYAFYSGNIPQAITGLAQDAIYRDINIVEDNNTEVAFVSGAFFNCSENSNSPDLCYVLCVIFGTLDGETLTGIFWIYNLDTKSWTRQQVDLLAIMRAQTASSIFSFKIIQAKVQGLLYTEAAPGTIVTNKRITGVLAIAGLGNVSIPTNYNAYSFLFPFFNSDKGEAVDGAGDIANFTVVYKQEEVILGTQPTVRGVIIKACGSGTLNVSVNGTAFQPIVVNDTTKTKTYISPGIYTGENPQLTITGNAFEGVVIKANMKMTYDEGEPV